MNNWYEIVFFKAIQKQFLKRLINIFCKCCETILNNDYAKTFINAAVNGCDEVLLQTVISNCLIIVLLNVCQTVCINCLFKRYYNHTLTLKETVAQGFRKTDL